MKHNFGNSPLVGSHTSNAELDKMTREELIDFINEKTLHERKQVEELQQLNQKYNIQGKTTIREPSLGLIHNKDGTYIKIDVILGVPQQCKHIWQKETLFGIVSCSTCGESKQR